MRNALLLGGLMALTSACAEPEHLGHRANGANVTGGAGTGVSAIAGGAGASGVAGAAGTPMIEGTAGSGGESGATGASGVSGEAGTTGDAGTRGSGAAGNATTTGNAGAGGGAGTSGAAGAAGGAGTVGGAGTSGAAGTTGGAGTSGGAGGGAADGGVAINYCDRVHWTATASVTGGDGAGPVGGIDGSLTTRWGNNRSQDGTDFYRVDFGGRVRLRGIKLDNTQAYPDDYPGAYAVYGSQDGTTFDAAPFVTGNGTMGSTVITFAERMVRAVRINQTGTTRNTNWWQIGEFVPTCSP